MINRNILILFISQSLGFAAVSFMVLLSGILSAQLGPSEKLSTLPLALMVVGTAVATIPAALLMQRLGRKAGVMLFYIAAIAGGILGLAAIHYSDFILLCLCTLLIGIFLACGNQLRFAAIESVTNKEKTGQVVSFMLFGGVIAAFLGPQLADWGKDLLEPAFSGSFLLLLATLVISLLIFCGFRNPAPVARQDDAAPPRPLKEILRQPVFLTALFSGVIAYAVMSFVMTATPISMHHFDGFDFAASKQVIQWHVAAMFLPSVFNIFLFRFFGIEKLMLAGAVIYLLVAALALQGHEFMHYNGALILLGIGWNFLFVAGTALLPQCYRANERFKAQAMNDFIIFGIQAVCSLGAGWLLFVIGWDAMIWLTVPVSILMLGLAVYYYIKTKNSLSRPTGT